MAEETAGTSTIADVTQQPTYAEFLAQRHKSVEPPAQAVPPESHVVTETATEEKPAQPQGEGADPDAEDAARASAAGKELAERKGRAERRRQSIQAEIDDLTTRKHTVRRDVEAEEARLATLRAELAALESKQKQQPSTETPAPAPKPTVDQFQTYEEFVEALSDWKADQKAAAAAAKVKKEIDDRLEQDRKRGETDAQARAQQALIAQHQARIDAARKAHADFDTVIAAHASLEIPPAIAEGIPLSSAGAEIMYHLAKNPTVADALMDLPITLPMRDAILDSAIAPKLLSHLAAHPEECAQLSTLPPRQALVAMGKLESRLDVASSSGPTSAAAPVTKAPAPPKPVGGGATATAVSLERLAAEGRTSEWMARRNAEVAEARRTRR